MGDRFSEKIERDIVEIQEVDEKSQIDATFNECYEETV